MELLEYLVASVFAFLSCFQHYSTIQRPLPSEADLVSALAYVITQFSKTEILIRLPSRLATASQCRDTAQSIYAVATSLAQDLALLPTGCTRVLVIEANEIRALQNINAGMLTDRRSLTRPGTKANIRDAGSPQSWRI